MALERKIVAVEGRSVHYLEDKRHDEQVLVFLHGAFGDADLSWAAALPELATRYRVIAPDLPGFGGSEPLPEVTFTTLIGWLGGFLDAVGARRVTLIGNSFGGLLARLFAAAYPERLRALILVNGGTLPQNISLLRMLVGLPIAKGIITGMVIREFTASDNLKQMIHEQSVLTDDFLQRVQAQQPGMTQVFVLLAKGDVPAAANPTIPTLLLWGAEDKLSPPHNADTIKAALPNSTIMPIAGCGHMPQLEATDVFTFQVQSYVENLGVPKRDKLPGVGRLGGKPPQSG
jgi:pimeloyl-ACP methyl ester carboxylesterase